MTMNYNIRVLYNLGWGGGGGGRETSHTVHLACHLKTSLFPFPDIYLTCCLSLAIVSSNGYVLGNALHDLMCCSHCVFVCLFT